MTAFIFRLFFVFHGLLCLNVDIVYGSENLSLMKIARQSTTFSSLPWGADRAVDGNGDQRLGDWCSVTDINDTIREAWWQVDLGQASYVKNIQILLQNDNGDTSRSRMAGYALYISDTPEILSGQLCYQHTGSELPPHNILQTCNLIGRYVTLYQTRSGTIPTGWSTECLLILCEVQVYGCPVGGYGFLSCNTNCSSNCINDTLCDPDDGVCIGGQCNPGWQGAKCDSVCSSGTFGPGCNSICEAQCRSGSCHHVTGTCPDGLCAAGYKNPNCSIVCEPGTYGIECGKTCSDNCLNQPCNHVNGSCPFGACADGWIGDKCNTICSDGKYGPGCMFECSTNCLNGTCHHVTSACSSCNAGSKGFNCTEECDPGTYGYSCLEQCSANCLYDQCNPVNGSCPSGKCRDGWIGDKCLDECSVGKYGPGCTLDCSSNCINGTCNHVTGACSLCNAGTKGFNCTEECDSGSYGYSCREKCSVHCTYQPCNSINGSCPFGKCSDGWTGERCSDACEEGFYGQKCNNTCGNCAEDAACDHVAGNCPGSDPKCKIGWKGSQCKTTCDVNTYGADCTGSCGRCLNVSTCNPLDGSCPYGCESGWEGASCQINLAATGFQLVENAGTIFGAGAGVIVIALVLVGIIVFRRKRYNENQKESNKKGNIRRLKSSYVTCDENNTNVDRGGSKRMNRISRGDNLQVGLGREGGGKISEEQRRVSHFICDLYALVDKPKSNREKHIVVIRNQHQRNSASNNRSSYSNSTIEPHYDSGEFAIADDNIYNEADDITKDTIIEEDIYESLDEVQSSNSTENLISEPSMRKMSNRGHSQKISENDIKNTHPLDQNPYLDMSSASYSKTSINLEDLKIIIYKKLTEKTFDDEFQKLPEGDLHPNEAGKTPPNKPKNRFATVLPYDHSRVVLEPLRNDTESTDYINASYIDGIEKPKAYIATQGPKKSTIRDFWRMIWQKQVGKIVMVTDFIEAGKVKCAKYWLQKGIHMKISIFIVTVEEEQEYAFYTVRKIKLVDTQTKRVRRVLHFHFTMWPDHGTPDPLQLVLFRERVSYASTILPGPMVVHCSAGLGRSGTFIGLDALMKNGWKTGRVDVFEYVKAMRENRTNMVQTADQYFIIHRALLEGFRLENTVISKDMFLENWEEMQKSDKPANRKKIRDQFQKLDYLRPEYDEGMFTSAYHADNANKNRTTVLPVDRYRPLLTSFSGRNDYINAVMIPSFTKPVGFLVTQFPLLNTVLDVWRLLFDHDSDTIISLGAINNTQQDGVNLSMSEQYNLGPFVVKQCSKKNISQDIIEIDINVNNKFKDQINAKFKNELLQSCINTLPQSKRRPGSDEETETKTNKTVKLYELKSWKAEETLPPNKHMILSLIELTKNERKQNSSGPIIVMCPDGAGCCGVLCAFSNSVERLEMDNEIDIFQTVRQLNIRRPEFINKLDQYSYCYDLVKEYLYPHDMYANT